MKCAVFYYSLSGKTKRIADYTEKLIREKSVSIDIIKIDYKKKKSIVFKIIDRLIKRHVDIAPEKVDVSSYDFIIVGSPIWFGSFTAPFTSFLNKLCNLNGKKIFLFSTHDHSNPEKLMKKTSASMKNKGAEVLGIESFSIKERLTPVDCAAIEAIVGRVLG